MRALLEKIRELTWPSTWYGWRLTAQSWWYTRDKSQFAFLGVLFSIMLLVPAGIYVLVNHAEASKNTERELACLARNIYHEARGEPLAGQYAVAEVTLNRVASSRFPDTICEVVFEQRWDRIRKRHVGAFSWTELDKRYQSDSQAFKDARKIAGEVYHKQVEPRVDDALFYHATYIHPSWARTKHKVASIGRHIFYK
ncbi:MAG: cell wall hydrolase [Thiohalophilus sp.]|jgi:spore germination cell wall hydrolase CwlJ-like protein